MNPRLQRWLDETRRRRFLPATLGTFDDSAEPLPDANQPPEYTYQSLQDANQSPEDTNQPTDATNQPPDSPNHNNTNFCPMPVMQQQGATLVPDDNAHPWAARVVHTKWWDNTEEPFLCTATAIKHLIFITAARCLATSKPYYTHLRMRMNLTVSVQFFVTPSPSTKQLFDDIGFIGAWGRIHRKPGYEYSPTDGFLSISRKPRAGGGAWRLDWAAGAAYKLVGFLAERESPSNQSLYELGEMYGSNSACNRLLPAQTQSQDYWAACVHSCRPHEHSREHPPCRRYLLGLGHAMLDDKNELVGIVTWSCGNEPAALARRGGLPLPLGVAVPDDRFQRNLECVEYIIKNNFDVNITVPGFYPSLCK
ncbi:uncharacterized protein LOC125240888 [Leguminivora glycinivorella]|uniref:uncharacterized protein LOC125240888 n=1 Tax=Leguminivora glycinivorella TaxID=1035111 RepID=UPI0020102B0A|nr:uncharacterized protein LOC125240888 [Leguminivora glycinivorella]